MALAARQLYFEAVKVGDELPPLVKPPVDRIQVARYAAAAQDWNPLYVDEQYARNSGFPSVLAPGMIAMGFLAELVVDWLRGARVRRFSSRFVKIVWPGDVLTCRGRVVERRFEGPGAYAVEIELWAENQRGELVAKGAVSAQLYYSAEDEARQRSGQGPLVVTQAEEEARLAKLSRAQPPKAPPPPPPPPKAPAKAPAKPAAAAPKPAGKAAAPAARPPPSAVKPPPPKPPAAKPVAGAAPAPAKSKAPVRATAARPERRGPAAKAARPAPRPKRPAPKPVRAKPKAARAAPRSKPTARGRSGGIAKPTPKKRR